MSTYYDLTPGACTVTFTEDHEVTVSEATARYDAVYLVAAGTYPLRPITIGGQDCSVEDAYHFSASFIGTLKSGGYPDQTRYVTTRKVGIRPYGYDVRERAEQQRADRTVTVDIDGELVGRLLSYLAATDRLSALYEEAESTGRYERADEYATDLGETARGLLEILIPDLLKS